MRIGDDVRAVLDLLPHIIWISLPSSEVVYLNRYGCSYLGVDAEGMDWRAVMHPDDIERIIADLMVSNRHRWPFHSEYRVRRADGVWRWHLGQSVLVTFPDGEYRIGTGTDIQDRVDLDGQLRHAHKVQAVGTLAGGIAHEFNNLLTMILANAALVADEVPAHLAAHVDDIRAAGERGAALTRELLGFARPTPRSANPIALDPAIANAIGTLQTALGAHVEIRAQLNAGTATVLADAAELHTIVMNLVMNARDAMPSGGPIIVATRSLDHAAVLEVIDCGAGFDDAVKARVFDPFFTTKRATNAAGLGLTMVYNLVRELGGKVDVESAPGRGTRFEIVLPCVAVPREHRSTRERAIERTVLLVDDDVAVLRALEHMMRPLGYRCLTATSGEDALALLAAHDIDLLVVDGEMPGMSGFELASIVHAIEGIHVILVTDPECPAATATPQLRRPFTASELAGAVRAALFG